MKDKDIIKDALKLEDNLDGETLCRLIEFSIIELEHKKEYAKYSINDNEFDIVFANLSIHFFNEEDTQKLLNEIHRILKPNGLFIGSVNSTSAYEFIKDHVTEIEKNYYASNGRNVRLFDESQFEMYFKNFDKVVLNEVIEKRFKHSKNMWEFIYIK